MLSVVLFKQFFSDFFKCGFYRTLSIHCRSTEVRRRNLNFFDRRRTTLNITSSNNIVGRRRKKLTFSSKKEWERVCFDDVYGVCYDGEKHTDDVSVKIQVPQAKKSFRISA